MAAKKKPASKKSTSKKSTSKTPAKKKEPKVLRPQEENEIFALDIGTRTVVGIIGHMSEIRSVLTMQFPCRINNVL